MFCTGEEVMLHAEDDHFSRTLHGILSHFEVSKVFVDSSGVQTIENMNNNTAYSYAALFEALLSFQNAKSRVIAP